MKHRDTFPMQSIATAKDAKEQRKQKIFELWLAGWTQSEIADAVGVKQNTLAETFIDFGDIAKFDKTQQSAADHATDFDVPIYNVWKQQTKKQILLEMGKANIAANKGGTATLSKIDKEAHNTRNEIAKELGWSSNRETPATR